MAEEEVPLKEPTMLEVLGGGKAPVLGGAGSTKVTLTLEVTYCATCGMPFAFSDRQLEKLRETHRTFYCPAGHGMKFCDKGPHPRKRVVDRLGGPHA